MKRLFLLTRTNEFVAVPGNKPWLLRIMTLSLLLLGAPGSPAADLRVGSGAGAPGASVLVSVSLASESPVAAVQFDLSADSNVLISDGAVAANPSGNLRILSREVRPGVRRVLIYSEDGLPLPAGELVNVPFLVRTNASEGTIPLALDSAVLADLQFGRLTPTQTAGAVTITTTSGQSIEFMSAGFDDTGVFKLDLSANVGQLLSVEFSPDLKSWSPLSSETAVGTLLRITDTNTVKVPSRFYRAVAFPR